MLAREVFWDALPCLSSVTLHVSPDWRSVEKDDAGQATTKAQMPSEAVRVFYKDVLRDRISSKESIKTLKIGWHGGGEHAEGMYARNNNILPAPTTQLDHSTAKSSVFGLVFKYVEHLTLQNCWITPPALEGLIKSHSSKTLKKLTLDSVSLTAHPRFPTNNGQGNGGVQQLAQAMMAMQGVANAPLLPPPPLQPPPPPLPLNHPQQPFVGLPQNMAQLPPGFLHNVHGLNAQQVNMMHQQWQVHMHQMQQMFNAHPNVPNVAMNVPNGHVPPAHLAGVPPPLQPPPPAPVNTNTANSVAPNWTRGHREGSWPQVVDRISPGIVLEDYLPPPAPWEEQLAPRPETQLQSIEFVSCGYARLPNHTGFDQLALEPDVGHYRPMSQWFHSRSSNLKSIMLETRDRNLGQIVQYIPQTELNALQFAWGLTEGWSDPAMAEEAEYDGLLPGGTGRFSGTIERGMSLIGRLGGSRPSTSWI